MFQTFFSRQVVHIIKEENGCLRNQHCTLTTAGIQATMDCNYTCSCDVKTYDIILLDRTDEMETVCEISMSPAIG